jgi:hypothetical protein
MPCLAGLLMAVAVGCAAPTLAQGTSTTSGRIRSAGVNEGPAWSSLNAAQRSALAPLEHEWPGIDSARRQKWLEVAARFPVMGTDERQRMQTRMTEWARMTPQERGAARLHFQEARQIDPADRQARWEQYQSLSPEQRQALIDRSRGSSSPKAPTNRKPALPMAKSNLVTGLPGAETPQRPVAPSVVQARTGATTTLISKTPSAPLHQQPGLPKIAASPGFVDRTTLLPQRGPQAAAITPAGLDAAGNDPDSPLRRR